MIQLFSPLKPSFQAQGALPAGPVWQGRDSLGPQCVGLCRAATWGAGPSQGALNLVLAHPHLVRADTWPNPGTLRMGVLSWPRTLTGACQGQSWQALTFFRLLLPTPRTHLPSLAALGPLHPQPCWWVMARTFPPTPAVPLCPLTTVLGSLCTTQSPSTAPSAGRDTLTLALSNIR